MTNRNFTTTEALEARLWDSERRSSPFSTVCDPEDETCEICLCDECDCEAGA